MIHMTLQKLQKTMPTTTLKTKTTRRVRWLAAAALLGMASGVTSAGAVIHHGHFRHMMHSGDTTGRVELAALAQRRGQWGVGATAGLRGEIIQIDGQLLVSPGSDAQGRVRPAQPGEQAVLFASASVAAWHEVVVPQDMDAAAFEVFLVEQARASGLEADQPFVFRVDGRFPHLVWHVVTGEPAPTEQGGGHGSHGGHGGAHANERSDMRLFRQPGASGELVGVYSGAALEGAVSHPGERLHIHYIDREATVSGHVDRFSLAAGAVLRLPVAGR